MMSQQVRGSGSVPVRAPSRGFARGRAFASLAALLMMAGCEAGVQGPGPGGEASVAVDATVASAPEAAKQQEEGGSALARAFRKADRVDVRLERQETGSTLVEQDQPFDPSSEVSDVRLALTLEEDRVPARLELALRRDESPLFEGAAPVTLVAGETVTVQLELTPVASEVRVRDEPVQFQQLADTARLTASVLFATGEVIPGADVQWSSGDPAVAEVFPDGTLISRGAGETVARASLDAHADSVPVSVELGPTGRLEGSVNEVRVGGGGGSAVAADMVSAQTNFETEALGGVTVEFLQDGRAVSRTSSRSDGSWTSPSLPTGIYEVRYRKEGFEGTTLFDAGIEEGTTASTLSVPLVPASDQAGTISGQIRDAPTGKTLAGVTVTLRPGVHNLDGSKTAGASTDSLGEYTISGAGAGTYTVTASQNGRLRGSTIGVIAGGETLVGQGMDVDLNLPPSVTISSPDDGETFFLFEMPIALQGSAEDPEDGALTGESLVWRSDQDGTLGTGEIVVADLSPGEHVLTLEATDSEGGKAVARITVTVALG